MTADELAELRSAFAELMRRRSPPARPRPAGPGELSTAQVRALIQLAKDEQVTAGELAKRAELSPGAMTAMLDQLEHAGMITRRRSTTDRRQVIVALTERGRAARRLQARPLGAGSGARAWPATARKSWWRPRA